jgi:glyoxylase-like metal-dependent hydrolase (beta-lactamase superfamily II)
MHTIELGHVTVTRIPHFSHWAMPATEFLPDSDQGLWEANRSWLSPAHWEAGTGRVRIAVQSWLLRSAGKTIIIDTGLAPRADRPGIPAGTPLPAALAAAGVAPEDVDLVLCTHLHADHVGWNTRIDDGQRVPAFPRARYLFSRPDLDFFREGGSAAVYAESIEPILRAEQALVWDDAHVIDENLQLRLAPGHTPGHGVVRLESGGDRAVFAGDLLHTPLQLHAPHLSSCFCHDRPAAARTRRAVLEWAADHAALVIPAHFAGAGAVEIAQNGSGFAVRRWAGFADDIPII